jgi:release factor glutamine methyltransferase
MMVLAERGWLFLQRALLRRRVGRLSIEQLDELSLVVLPAVFNPAVFRTSPVLLDAVVAHVHSGMRVLDVGTGTGAAAIRAALAGGQVTAIDVNPEAVRCARINVLLNNVAGRVEVRHGDLFGPVAGERYDIVLCNPPFFRGRPADSLDAAWRSEDLLERFCEGLADALRPEGYALLVFSNHGDEAGLVGAVARAGLVATNDRVSRFGSEVVTVYRIARRES